MILVQFHNHQIPVETKFNILNNDDKRPPYLKYSTMSLTRENPVRLNIELTINTLCLTRLKIQLSSGQITWNMR